MAVIAIYSVKGGVGKTTLAANLAYVSAATSCRETLLWDLDAAGGAGWLLGVDPAPRRGAQGVFAGSTDPARLIRPTATRSLDILPADESIRLLDRQFAAMGKKRRLAKIAATLAKRYDRIVLDCPPALNEVSAQVMRAADIVLVPLPPSPLSARAFALVVDEVRANGGAAALLPVHSMLDLRRTLHRQARDANADWPAIPLASAVEQCATRRAPVGAFAPRSAAARAFGELWTAVERRLMRA